MTIGNSLNTNLLTASRAVVTDASKNLTSLQYTDANTASTLVQRNASGNFSAGTITSANLIGTTDIYTTSSTTWTPSVGDLNNLSGTPSVTRNSYRSIGKIVFCKARITGLTVTSANTLTFFSVQLPVSMSAVGDGFFGGACLLYLTSGYFVTASPLDWDSSSSTKVGVFCYPTSNGATNYYDIGLIYESA